MSKRKVHFASTSDGAIEETIFEADSGKRPDKILKLDNDESIVGTKDSLKEKKKHTLDSDEEVEEDHYNVLDDEDIEGQEDTSTPFQGDEGRFTSFNMKEELEEGHFDKEGTYIFDKDNKITDNWMDNVDWVQVKHTQGYAEAKEDADSSSDDDDEDDDMETGIDKVDSYRKMLTFMKPNETILKSLRRLGGGKSAPSRKWQKNSATKSSSDNNDKVSLDKLTGLANTLLQSGDYEIYQCTFEKLTHLVKIADDQKVSIPSGTNEDDALDMFADSIDTKQADNGIKSDKATTKSSSAKVKWQYKWKNGEDCSTIHGPYTSLEMQEWTESGFFAEKPILVRKTTAAQGADKQFYDAARIDFELYT